MAESSATTRGAGSADERSELTTATDIVLFTNSMVMGGMEEHVLQLGSRLVARGYRVAVICSRQKEIAPLRDGLTAAGVEVHALSERRTSPAGALPRTLALTRILRRYAGGVLHLHFTGHTGGDLVTLAARLAGMRAVVRSVHLPPLAPASRTARLVVGLRDRQLARIICVSSATRLAHLELLGRDEGKCVVVHNGVDLQRFSPLTSPVDVRAEFGIDPASPIVGTVSRLGEERKGIDHFIDAAAIVARRRPDVSFLVVGDGGLRGELERRAAARGIGRKVIFTGHRDDVPRLLATMRVFASPSLYEACQYNLLEAMAMERPVVSTPTGVAPEVISDRTTGRLVPIADSASLAHAIGDLLEDPSGAGRMARAGREAIVAQYSVDAMVDGILGVYRAVVSGAGSARRRAITAR